MCVLSCSILSDSFAAPWTVACQAPLSVGLPRQEYWSGLPFPSPGHLPHPGTELNLLHLLHWLVDSSHLSTLRSQEIKYTLLNIAILLLFKKLLFVLYLMKKLLRKYNWPLWLTLDT